MTDHNDKVILVDNFYANPDRVREMGLANTFADISATDYPGYSGRKSVASKGLRSSIESLVGYPLNVDTSRFTWGGFRFITAESAKGAVIHADVAVEWAGMVYLTPDLSAGHGTGFFRHRETGLEGPPTDRVARSLGFADSSEFDDKVVRPVKAEHSRWEMYDCVEAVYNRLVLFRGEQMYHAPVGGAGSTPETARLTHIFFFNTLPRARTMSVSVPPGLSLNAKD
jgi:hypothetical protein